MTEAGGSPAARAPALLERCLREPEFVRRYHASEWHPLGEGRFSGVYRFYDRDLGRDVALKLFWQLTPELRTRIQAEVQNAQRIRSELVVQIHTVYFGAEAAWLQMELVDGPDLEHELRRRGVLGTPFTLNEALACAAAVAEALAQAHAVGVIHRDVKPSNFLLPASRQPFVKLGDFGISKHRDAAHLTSTGEFPGTPAYAAPEVFDGRPTGPASDVYSLGLVLFRILCRGQYAYALSAQPTPAEFLMAHRKARPLRLRDLQPGLPGEIEEAVLQALSKSAVERPEARLLADVIQNAREPKGFPLARGRRRRISVLVLAGAAASVGVVGAVVSALVSWPTGSPVSAPAASPPAGSAARVSQSPGPSPTADPVDLGPRPVADAPSPVSPTAVPLVASSEPYLLPRPERPAQRSPAPAGRSPDRPPSVDPSGTAAQRPMIAVSPSPVAVPSPLAPPSTTLAAVAAHTPASLPPTTLAAVPPPSTLAAASRRFVTAPTVVLGVAPQLGRLTLDFEVRPPQVEPGAAFVVEAYLSNASERALKVEALDLVTTTNGRRGGSPGTPLNREVKRGRRERVARLEGRWPVEIGSWSVEVFLRAADDVMVKGAMEWR